MKVLIISHNPVSAQNNMGKTFLSLFSQFQKEELCQIYIYPTIPNVDSCNSFYRVTDKEILKSLLCGKKVGQEIRPELTRENQGMFETAADESFYRSRKNKSALRRLLRDAMWSLARWNNDQLAQWLDRERPDCIFVAPGVAKFIYDLALKIADSRKIPIVSYICDEYYFVKEPRQWLDKLRLGLLKKKIRILMEASSHLVVISEELRQAYAKEFRLKTTTLMTGTSYALADTPREIKAPKEICYFGNIRCNRYISLGEVGRELDRINQEMGADYKLKIYTAENNPEILASFSQIRSIELCGFLTGETFDRVFHEAQLLLHVEAFDEESIDFTQHSVSTKIADSLASGIPLLAYGPECISSMQHLLRNGCAITATSKEGLRDMLMTAFSDADKRMRVAEQGLTAAKKFHNGKQISSDLRKILTEAAERGVWG